MNKMYEKIIIVVLGLAALLVVYYMMRQQQEHSEWVRQKQTFIQEPTSK